MPTTESCLWKIATSKVAPVPVATLPSVFEVPAREVSALLRSLLAAESVVEWKKHPSGPGVTISASTAARFGLVLVRLRWSEFRWCNANSPLVRKARVRDRRPTSNRVETNCDHGASSFDELPDDLAIDTLAILEDEAYDDEQGRSVRADLRVRPRRIWGTTDQWPLRHHPGERCRACRHRSRFDRAEFCLVCERVAGESPRAPAQRSPHVIQLPRPRLEPRNDGLDGGIGRRNDAH